MNKPRVRTSILRGLRFRLTLTNAIFLVLLLIAMGFFFRGVLQAILDNQVRDLLAEEWGAVKGYLVIHRRVPNWHYDAEDQEESYIVERLRRVFLLADANGKQIFVSPIHEDLGVIKPEEIRAALASNQPLWLQRRSSEGELFLLRGGVFVDDNNTRYFVSIGRSLAINERTLREFNRDYFTLLPLLILAGSLLGWFVAGRALSPVNELAQTAESISGSNLSLRIPRRGSGDELDHLIQTFNTMVERLEHSFRMTRQFSTDVSHELRTPLTAIRGQLEVALFTADSKEQYRDAIVNALEDVERLSQTIRAMLLLSQAESGQLMLQRSTLDLSPLVEDFVDQFQIPAEEAKVELTCSKSGVCLIDGDRIQIERMISNLLSNAVKYTHAGGTIHVSVKAGDGTVILEFADTGVGISPDHLPNIFDRFYRVPGSSREKHGLGLGLSFVAWIVKIHGGTVTVDSKLGEGTRFVITLPAAQPSVPDATPVALEQGTPQTPSPTAGPAQA